MRVEPFHSIIHLIADRRIKGATRVIVAIDGAGGAGKSTVAKWIRDELKDVSIVEMDDFYRVADASFRRSWNAEEGYQNFFDWTRLRDDVLKPIQDGISPEFQPYDWTRNQLNGWKQVPLTPVIIVEGVYALRPELRPLYNLSVFIEAPLEVRTARLRTRTDSEQDIQMWQAAENWYLANIKPQDNCDLVVSGY